MTPTAGTPLNPVVFDGALRCLVFFAAEIPHSHMLPAAQRLLPWMLTILSSPGTPAKCVLTRALALCGGAPVLWAPVLWAPVLWAPVLWAPVLWAPVY